MKLVVGLGNPGSRYARTRHNIGFRVLDQLAATNGNPGWQSKFDGLTADVLLGNERTLLLKPMTFMNLSGSSVRKAIDFYKLPPSDLLVVCDDMDLPLGRLRLRKSGSSGGQKGLKNILQLLATEEVPRLRIGIGAKSGRDAVGHVLSDFGPQETKAVEEAVIDAALAVECWRLRGMDEAMNRFNRTGKTEE